MKNGGLIPWSATAIYETVKTLYRIGKHIMNGDLESH